MRIAQCEVHTAVGCASERAAMLTVTRRTRGPKDQGSCDNVERTIEMRDASCEPAGRCKTTARKALRTAKVRACACTNTWIREAYNLGALRTVITMTALTLTPGAASPATHAREPRSAPGSVETGNPNPRDMP